MPILLLKNVYTAVKLSVLVAVLLFSFSACQTLKHETKDDSKRELLSWVDHKEKLEQLESWHLKGKIGFTFPYENKTRLVSANLDWKKKVSGFDMALSGPLGMGEFTIEKRPEQTRLTNHKGDVYEAASPEQLFYQHTGMKIPWSDLEWWVLGMPAPGKMHSLQFSPENQRLPESLQQSGWTVQFISYQDWQGNPLPQKIKFTNGEIKATLIARDWELD